METLSQKEISSARLKISKTIAYYVSFIALGMTTASLGPTLPGLAEHTNTRLGEISFLFTARALGYLLGSMRGGRWYDRKPGHRVAALMLLLMAGMMVLIPTLPLLWILAAALLALGFGEGTLDVGCNTLLVWVHREGVGPFMNALHFFFGIGSFLAPIIIAQAILLSGDITWAYWALAILVLPAAAVLWRLSSPEIPPAARSEQAGQVNYGLVALIALYFFLNVGAEGSFGGWIYTYARAMNLGTEITAAYLTSAFWGAFTVGRLLSIPIAAFLRPRWILLGDMLGCLASLGLIILGQGSYTAAWLGTIGTGLFMASIFPTTITLAGRHLPINGRITGWFFVGASAGGMSFPWLIGQFFEPAGPRSAMVIILAAMVAAVLVFAGLLLAIRKTESRREITT
jgi:FHS family Na+ dependent glucose MFS transporter 1